MCRGGVLVYSASAANRDAQVEYLLPFQSEGMLRLEALHHHAYECLK